MSRVGKIPIKLPSGVSAVITEGRVLARGPKGEVAVALHPHVKVVEENGTLRVNVADPENRSDRALWGLTARLIQNAVNGVTQGFERQLELFGVGFRAELRGDKIELSLGFSHPVVFDLPADITAAIEKNVITLRGVDRQLVGETAARLRSLRKPDAYHGKGIRYVGETLKLKPGKAAKTGTAAK